MMSTVWPLIFVVFFFCSSLKASSPTTIHPLSHSESRLAMTWWPPPSESVCRSVIPAWGPSSVQCKQLPLMSGSERSSLSPDPTSPPPPPPPLVRSADGTVLLRSLKHQRVLGELWSCCSEEDKAAAPLAKLGLSMSVSGDCVSVAVAAGVGGISLAAVANGSLRKVGRSTGFTWVCGAQ